MLVTGGRLLTFVLCLICIVFQVSSVESLVLSVPSGQTAELPCDPDSQGTDGEAGLVLWYKDGSTTPIYSADARGRQPSTVAVKHSAANDLQGRATLDPKTRILKIHPSLKTDEGIYKCRADFKNARTRYFTLKLIVVVPPGKPVIADETGEILQSLIGPYNEGDRLALVCEVEGGDPAPSLTWWRESVLLDSSFEHISPGIARNEMEIPVLQRHDLMAVLSCVAKNDEATEPPTATVTVDLNFRPLDVKIDSDRKPMSAQKATELVCRSWGSRPPALVSWWKGTTRLNPAEEHVSVDGNMSISVLHFVPRSVDHGQVLTCRAENFLMPTSILQDVMKLDVQYVPQVSLRLGNKLRHTHIQETNDVYFECSVKSNPSVTLISWVFEGQELHTNTTAGIILSNHSLVLQNLQRNQKGKYQCKATNKEGEALSNTVTLRIQHAPFCRPGQKRRYGAALGERVRILCEVDADPPPVSFRWLLNGSTYKEASEEGDEETELQFESGGLQSVARLTLTSEDGYGELLCWADNSVGSQTVPCSFHIYQAGPPEAVKNCSVTNQTETSFQVQCQMEEDGAPPKFFTMEVTDESRRLVLWNRTSSSPTFLASNLAPGASFQVTVYAVNSKGRSAPNGFSATTLIAPESLFTTSGNWTLNLSPVLLVLVVVVAVLVALAFVLVVAFKFKRNRDNNQRSEGSKPFENKLSMDVLMKKDAGDLHSVSGCYDEQCPDIISDFSGREEGIKTITSVFSGDSRMNVKVVRPGVFSSKDRLHEPHLPSENSPSGSEDHPHTEPEIATETIWTCL